MRDGYRDDRRDRSGVSTNRGRYRDREEEYPSTRFSASRVPSGRTGRSRVEQGRPPVSYGSRTQGRDVRSCDDGGRRIRSDDLDTETFRE